MSAKNKTLKWTSTNPAVATVSQTGVVRAVKAGETYINVASVNGKSDIMKLTVQPGDRTDRLNLGGSDVDTGSTSITGSRTTTNAVNGTVKYTHYNKTLSEMVEIQMNQSPAPKYNGGSEYASRDMVEKQMDPTYDHDGAYKYQFLDLSQPNGATAEQLNKYLSGKGVLAGHGQDFIDAANEYGVSELYLVAHSMLETGNGTSTLARGVEVNGTTVYNMFGIGAYDNSAVYSGSRKAYTEGWTSVGAAIKAEPSG
jgi:beta-N-acetylglucosaminidase